MSDKPTCRKCHKNPPATINGTCEDCLKKSVVHMYFKERPICRQRINELLKDTPGLNLVKIAFWKEFDNIPLIPSDNMVIQAKRMIAEEYWRKRF